MNLRGHPLRLAGVALLATVLAFPSLGAASHGPAASARRARSSRVAGTSDWVRLPGHVLSALTGAERLPAEPSEQPGDDLLTVTVVLKRDHQAEFEAFVRDLYDPASLRYRHFITQREIAEHFGPSRAVHDRMLHYLRLHGFTLVQDSINRLTLTVRGTRTAVAEAFAVEVGDYRAGPRIVHLLGARAR